MNKSTFFIIGQHAVFEALKNPRRKVLKVFPNAEKKLSAINIKGSVSLAVGPEGDFTERAKELLIINMRSYRA